MEESIQETMNKMFPDLMARRARRLNGSEETPDDQTPKYNCPICHDSGWEMVRTGTNFVAVANAESSNARQSKESCPSPLSRRSLKATRSRISKPTVIARRRIANWPRWRRLSLPGTWNSSTRSGKPAKAYIFIHRQRDPVKLGWPCPLQTT